VPSTRQYGSPDVGAMSAMGPFNSPLECGLRALALLVAATPATCDLQRLVFYDYLLVHSGDVPNGPDSIHPATPLRSGEALVRRHWIERGLLLMISRELVTRNFSERGIMYEASPLTASFLSYMEEPYTRKLQDRAQWVITTFGEYSDYQLVEFFKANLDRWGGEFIREELLEDEL
jgi:hypothetical protein